MSARVPNPDEGETALSAVRLLGLRRFPGLAEVDVDDLAKLLAATTERAVPAHSVLSRRGAPLAAAYFIIEGTVRMTKAGGPSREVGPNETAGMIEMVAEDPDGVDIECLSDVVVLELESADFVAFIAENFDMLEVLVRTFSAQVLALSPFERTREDTETTFRPGGGFVDRLVFLQRLRSFQAFGAATTAALAAAMEESRPPPGVLVPAGGRVDSLYVVAGGKLRLGAVEIRPGGAFGLLHCVAESPLPFDVGASDETVLLTCPREIVVDLLEDNVSFTLAWLRELARRLLELNAN